MSAIDSARTTYTLLICPRLCCSVPPQRRCSCGLLNKGFRRALTDVGAAVTAAACTTFACTFVLAFAQLVPFARFGALASLNIFLAAVVALLVLPSILLLAPRLRVPLTCTSCPRGCRRPTPTPDDSSPPAHPAVAAAEDEL